MQHPREGKWRFDIGNKVELHSLMVVSHHIFSGNCTLILVYLLEHMLIARFPVKFVGIPNEKSSIVLN